MAKNGRKKPAGTPFINRVVGFLFVILILLAVAITFDYILFAFHKTPVFAVKVEEEAATEHVGLIYVVTEAGTDLKWDWIWQKF